MRLNGSQPTASKEPESGTNDEGNGDVASYSTKGLDFASGRTGVIGKVPTKMEEANTPVVWMRE